jgi:hypothetical protein
MNFITKKHLSRRTLLRGAGVTVALPFLESMLPAQTPLRVAGAVPKTRLASLFGGVGYTVKAMGTLWLAETLPGRIEISRFYAPRSAGRDAVQIAIAAQIELVVHQRRRGVEPIVERVGRQHLEARSVADDERRPVAAGDVHTALRSDR